MKALQHVNIKLFAETGSELEPERLIPIFHRWIQDSAVPGMLIDVTDYSHVPAGPGVMLIGHDGFYSVDHREIRPGFLYNHRLVSHGTTQEQLLYAWKAVTTGARQLESDLEGKARFSTNHLQVFVNDRILAPNSDATFEAVAPELKVFFETALGEPVVLEHDANPRGLFRVNVRPAA
ncbi:MAG TPA: hypothetical protein VES20_19960 [Bryobacteraceae bacterium]|nr:hypothetical protein [Bryobacteraceae bacterium]